MYNDISDTLIIGKKVIYLPSCHSTNDIAAEIVHAGIFEEGTIVITDNQVQGRGQRGTVWSANPGENLTFSVILKPDKLPVADQFTISQLTALAIRSYVGNYIHDTVIKWPNDIYANGKKICGVLIENSLQGNRLSHSIVGIGVNVNQMHFDGGGTSLFIEAQKKYTLAEEFEKLARHLDASFIRLHSENAQVKVKTEYLNQLHGYHKKVSIVYQGRQREAKVVDLTREGKLLLELQDEARTIEVGLKEIEWVFD